MKPGILTLSLGNIGIPVYRISRFFTTLSFFSLGSIDNKSLKDIASLVGWSGPRAGLSPRAGGECFLH